MLKPCHVAGKAKSRELVDAFIAGAPADAEGRVFWGVDDSNLAEWHAAIREGSPWYYGDNAFFDATRGQRFRFARNRLQIQASKLTTTGRRFEAMGLDVRPWREDGDHWLLVEQSEHYMRTIACAPDWLRQAERALPADGRRRLWRNWDRDKARLGTTLPAALVRAWGCVTYSSAAAVEAALRGVHILVGNQSALYGMAAADRERMLGVLADHEWTLDEMRAGMAWETLHRCHQSA